jgi:hypothetical protein
MPPRPVTITCAQMVNDVLKFPAIPATRAVTPPHAAPAIPPTAWHTRVPALNRQDQRLSGNAA